MGGDAFLLFFTRKCLDSWVSGCRFIVTRVGFPEPYSPENILAFASL